MCPARWIGAHPVANLNYPELLITELEVLANRLKRTDLLACGAPDRQWPGTHIVGTCLQSQLHFGLSILRSVFRLAAYRLRQTGRSKRSKGGV